MNEQIFSPCGDHQALLRMPFERALAIAEECDECYIETLSDVVDDARADA